MLDERVRAGQSATGTYGHDYSVGEVTASEATVEDCLTADISLTGADGATTTVPTGPYAVRASLVREDGRWRVAELESTSSGCAASGPPPSSVSSSTPSGEGAR